MRGLIEGLVTTVVGACALWGAWLVPPALQGEVWAGAVPMIAAVGLTLTGVWMSVSALNAEVRENGRRCPKLPGPEVLGLAGLAVVYPQTIQWFGYLLPTAVTAPLALAVFGVRHPLYFVLAGLLCPVGFHIVFFEMLGVFPPYGEIFDLGDWLWRLYGNF